MTDQKPTGVFVRLPVTDDQAQEMYRAYCAAYASSSLTTRGTATQAALLSIGTPVQADGLKTFLRAIVSGKSLVGMLEPDSKREMPDVFEDIPLVRQSDAQSQIAARDAEIVRLKLEVCHANDTADAAIGEVTRLQEALVAARDAITSDLNAKSIVCTVWAGPAETLVDYIDAALKGGAA